MDGATMGFENKPRVSEEALATVVKGSRAPLEWQTVESFVSGRVKLVLQSARQDNGQIRYSFRIGKNAPAYPDRPFPFMSRFDTNDVRKVLGLLEQYLGQKSINEGANVV